MRLIVTDEGWIWNHNNPCLEAYKDVVLVVCLNGKKVTDKYECLVTPYSFHGLGSDSYGYKSRRLASLASIGDAFSRILWNYDDIVFLADYWPPSLYPLLVCNDFNRSNRLHLIAVPPMPFLGRKINDAYHSMLSDLSGISSVCYYDPLEQMALDKNTNASSFFDHIENELCNLLPHLLNGINDIGHGRFFFNFSTMKYTSVETGFKECFSGVSAVHSQLDFTPMIFRSTLGMLAHQDFPSIENTVKSGIQETILRIDGKRICELLRGQRLALAAANHIRFESEDCPSIGPCAGTCEKCDREAAYLRNELNKIPEYQRQYPHFKVRKDDFI